MGELGRKFINCLFQHLLPTNSLASGQQPSHLLPITTYYTQFQLRKVCSLGQLVVYLVLEIFEGKFVISSDQTGHYGEEENMTALSRLVDPLTVEVLALVLRHVP